MQYILTIIVPVYNVENYLPECLISLRKQNFPINVEILLVDDGSIDKSGKNCDEIMVKDKHFVTFHKKNGGVASARNYGLERARGEYIAWVDPDDYITDDWWQIIQPILAQKPEMIYFDLKMLKNGTFENRDFDKQSRIIGRDELIYNLANDRIPSHMVTKILPREKFKNNLFNEKRHIFEDYQVMHKLTFSVQQCIYLHHCLYVYRQREGSILHDNRRKLLNNMFMVITAKERVEFYQQHGVKVNADEDILRKELKFCVSYRQQENNKNDIITEQIKIEYQKALKDLRQHRQFIVSQNFMGEKAKHLSIEEQVFCFERLNLKTPLLWGLWRHPVQVLKAVIKIICKNTYYK